MTASLQRGQVVILRPRHVMERPARVRVETFVEQFRAYSGIQLGLPKGHKCDGLPALRVFRGESVTAVWQRGLGFRCVLPGVL